MAIHSIVVKTFHYKTKMSTTVVVDMTMNVLSILVIEKFQPVPEWWADRFTLPSIEPQMLAWLKATKEDKKTESSEPQVHLCIVDANTQHVANEGK